MKALGRLVHAHGVRLISDEIYHGIVYEGETRSRRSRSPSSAIVVNSFSKYFSMTGWRVGWLVVPTDLVRPIERLDAELLHLRADAQPARRAGRLRLPRRARRPRPPLPRQPRPADGRACRRRASIAWRRPQGALLPLCRRRPPHQRQPRVLPAHAAPRPAWRRRPASTSTARAAPAPLRISFAGSTAEMEEAVRRLKAWRRA